MKNLVVATNVLVVFVFGLGMLVGLAAFEPQTAQKTAAPAAAPALAPTPSTTCSRLSRSILTRCSGRCCSARRTRARSGAQRVAPQQPVVEGHAVAGRREEPPASTTSFVAIAMFPEVVDTMAQQIDWTTQVGQAFAADRTAVFASIQRLRSEGAERRQAEEHRAAGRRDPHDVQRPAGHRHRTRQPAGRLRAAVQPADRSTRSPTSSTVVIQDETTPRRQWRRADRFHRRHRAGRRDRQRLLLRSVRMARRRLHVRRRVGRLGRPPRGCARRLAGPPRRSGRRARRSRRRRAGAAQRARADDAGTTDPAARSRGRRTAPNRRPSASSGAPTRRPPARTGRRARRPRNRAATAATRRRRGSAAAPARMPSRAIRVDAPSVPPASAASAVGAARAEAEGDAGEISPIVEARRAGGNRVRPL